VGLPVSILVEREKVLAKKHTESKNKNEKKKKEEN
jgi:hypothetical protein